MKLKLKPQVIGLRPRGKIERRIDWCQACGWGAAMAQKRATWPLRIFLRTLDSRTLVSWWSSMRGIGMVAGGEGNERYQPPKPRLRRRARGVAPDLTRVSVISRPKLRYRY